MTIRLYDLAAAEDDRRFSPHCWRVRLALAHKGLEVETVPWRFTEKDAIAFSGQGSVPVLVDGETVVHDSWEIAEYLDETYPQRPLFACAQARAAGLFIKHWTEQVLQPAILRVIVADVVVHLHERDRAYYRETRERRLGAPIEDVASDRAGNLERLRTALQTLRLTLAINAYVGGDEPNYADHIVFGAFQWARVCSDIPLVEPNDPVCEWRQRMLDAYGGLAAKAIACSA
jgi:glutathione S-transferase